MMWRPEASFQRSNSHDKVRRIVAEEGRTARNLIAWNVPLESKDDDGKHKGQTGGKSKRTIQSTHKISKQEVLMMLDYYVRDFKALIDWIQLQEKLEKTDAQSRPTSLAWEVKKMSPGRHVIPSPSTDRMNVTSTARRSLNFGSLPGTVTATCLAPTGVSWADKVKAHHTGSATSDVTSAQPCAPTTVQKTSRKNERKDAEGWETVQRGRPVRPRSTAVMPRVSLVTETVKSKDDSDKENVCLLPGERTQKGDLVDDRPSVVESPSKDSFHPSDRPLAERTQFTVSILDDVKNSGSSQDSSVHTSEIPAVHSDAVCLAVTQQATSALPTDKDRVLADKVGIVNETDPSDISNSMAEVLAKKEELADRLEKANEEAIASAIAEEEQLTREIEAEENNDISIETDNDSDFSASMGSGSLSFCGMSMDWNDVLADYEARESWRQNTSWGDIVEEEPARLPGHGIHMHEKLSSPSRKRTIAESKKKYEEKHMKAQQLREKLREEKTLKLQKLLEREKDVRKWKEELLDQRRRMMEEKLLHAEFKREVQLQAIVKKAQEEEAKVNEIAFINTLEAQNKRHDVLSKLKEYEQRLNELQEERQRRQEEKQARDEAVQERKRALEAERQARVEELLMKRKEQEARIEQQRQEKEKAREDAARERARDREERLAALTAAQQEAMEELQKKIQLKHDESIRRHMEQIEQRKEKAAELSSGRHASTDYAPKLTPYERKKQCSLCNVLEHLSLKKYVVDIVIESTAPPEPVKDGEERQKNKKKAKKIKARMNSRAKEYESLVETKNYGSDSPYKAKLQRLAKDLVKQIQVQDSGSWANNKASALDRTLGEVARILEKECYCFVIQGFSFLNNMLTNLPLFVRGLILSERGAGLLISPCSILELLPTTSSFLLHSSMASASAHATSFLLEFLSGLPLMMNISLILVFHPSNSNCKTPCAPWVTVNSIPSLPSLSCFVRYLVTAIRQYLIQVIALNLHHSNISVKGQYANNSSTWQLTAACNNIPCELSTPNHYTIMNYVWEAYCQDYTERKK
ncbi:Scaper [Phodopus roborovskii]|uniref:Scaper protein n=1 Tax=Phodopus roborovskii TaxID=109678 RepID=A0AAU9ZSE9_PHORO|nr:Scaper [Phodopus roborovskii]